jgi:hypothetical protein
MSIPKTMHDYSITRGLLEQLRGELADGAERGASRCGFANPRERTSASIMALIYAAKLIAQRNDMTELYHVMLAGEIPAFRAGREEVE